MESPIFASTDFMSPMQTRRQKRLTAEASVKEEPEIKEEPHAPSPEPILEEASPPLGVADDDVTAGLRIQVSNEEDNERLQKLRLMLSQQERSVKDSCENVCRVANEEADELRERLIQQIRQLPAEFLDSSAEEMAHLQLPCLQNIPSVGGRANASVSRVVRVFNKDTDTANMMDEWDAKYEEINKKLFSEERKDEDC